jgi:hypothetical protein
MDNVRAERILSAFDSLEARAPARRYTLRSAVFPAWLTSGVCLNFSIDARFAATSLIVFVASVAAAGGVQLAAAIFSPPPRRPQVLDISGLDQPAHDIFYRARRALLTIIGSALFAAGRLNNQATELELRRQELDLVDRLTRITDMQAAYNANCYGSVPGPQNAATLHRHWRDLVSAQESVASWVAALERYAAEVQRADAAERDLELARKLERLDARYLDLAAATAADEHAIATVNGMTDEVAALRAAMEHALRLTDPASDRPSFPGR